ncbi:hypothetical protein GW17_00041849 [Ensete ventricosum]|nr:hypothetical protein GW17_00041849 [Ensete ventricosum]
MVGGTTAWWRVRRHDGSSVNGWSTSVVGSTLQSTRTELNDTGRTVARVRQLARHAILSVRSGSSSGLWVIQGSAWKVGCWSGGARVKRE